MDPVTQKRFLVIIILLVGLVVMGIVPLPQSINGVCYTEPVAVWTLNRIGAGQITFGCERNLIGANSESTLLQFDRPDLIEVVFNPKLYNGSFVEVGDTVATIVSREGMGRLSILEAELDKGYAEHQALQTGARIEDIEVAVAQVNKAKVALETYKLELNRASALHDSGFIPDSAWLAVERQYKLLDADLELARTNLEALEAGSRPEDIQVAEDQIEVLNRSVASSQRLLGNQEFIITPISGRVNLTGELGVLMRIERIDTLAVIITIPEAVAPLLRQGQSISLDLRADPMADRLSQLLQVRYSWNNFPGTFALGITENPDMSLQPGMTGRASLSIGKRTIFSGFRAKFNF